ncbi:hypothetical protein BCF74_10355 [Knoellia remsis]|uniref:Uncharacterized protein n=1 Tax=Knoellia remsis TaxID=407159 RepID=A0A2T0UYD2_9MICO|nr:hypothetical protein [Knoellia remsis]PRY62848.1 hypothetical protein BCF74_10355 [Knoellia remsis]
MADVEVTVPEVAYYYPAPYWGSGEVDAVKTLLLFFDEIAILRPQYMAGIEVISDPVLAGPLTDLGLLRVLEPEAFVDQEMTEDLATAMVALLTTDAFEHLDPTVHFQELSQSRVGWGADVGLASMLTEELTQRGLARPSEDGLSIPMHPEVRTTILVLLAQLARAAGRRQGIDLHPATSQQQPAAALVRTLTREQMPSAGHLVALDLEAVSLDLSRVPLDELLDFRRQHATEYRLYARQLRSVLTQLGPMEEVDRQAALADRREELAERAFGLRRTSRGSWTPDAVGLTSVSLGLAGASWELAGNGDPVSAALALAAGLTGLIPARTVDAYSYLISAGRNFT